MSQKRVKKQPSYLSKLWQFVAGYYFIIIIVLCVGFVGAVSAYKFFIAKPTYIYVRVKVGQGLWWASTLKPNQWLIEAIRHTTEENDLIGGLTAKLTEVIIYPWTLSGQYDVYVTAKIRVSKQGNTGKYSFKRETLGVGGPIEFEFPNVQFSGSVVELSEEPLVTRYIEKTVYLTKKYGFPWEYEAIQIGDTYNDGKEVVFNVLDKTTSDSADFNFIEWNPISTEIVSTRQYITIKALIKGQMINDQFVFGQEQVVAPGKAISVSTNRFTYSDFVISKVE